jgi:hypothetical protein
MRRLGGMSLAVFSGPTIAVAQVSVVQRALFDQTFDNLVLK